MDFKVGDTVKIIKINESTRHRYVGKIGTIREIKESGPYPYRTEVENDAYFLLKNGEFELVVSDVPVPSELIEEIINTFRIYISDDDLVNRASNLLALNDLITERLTTYHPNYNKYTGAIE